MKLDLNGNMVEIKAESNANLLFVLRDVLGLTGTKYGCGGGYCGACSILVNGSAVKSCTLTLDSVKGKKVTTIEGISNKNIPDEIQNAFIESNASQCGFCIPGIIIAVKDLLGRKNNPSDSEIRSWLNGNLCRCGTHVRIIRAVKLASKKLKGEK